MEAQIVKFIHLSKEQKQLVVSCPYCKKEHKHGYEIPEHKQIVKNWRSSHCHKGEYFFKI